MSREQQRPFLALLLLGALVTLASRGLGFVTPPWTATSAGTALGVAADEGNAASRRDLLGAAGGALLAGALPTAAAHADEVSSGNIATFNIKLQGKDGTTTEQVHVRLRPDWAPRGVKRFKQLVNIQDLEDSVVYHVDEDMARFGLPADPTLLRPDMIKDDLVRTSNSRGTLTFAQRGPDTRISEMFFNKDNNGHLDRRGFAPIGEVLGDGMEVIDRLYQGYGTSPSITGILTEGNQYLDSEYPKLSRIESVEVHA